MKRVIRVTTLVLLVVVGIPLFNLSQPRPSAASTSIYWGAVVDGAPGDLRHLDTFESKMQKKLSILHLATAGMWGTGNASQADAPSTAVVNGQFQPFPRSYFDVVRARGSIPLYTWMAMDKKTINAPHFQSKDIYGGAYDDYITYWARAARDWGHPFFLRLNHEMNGNWYPWSDQVNGNQPGDYVKAWRHVHDIFTREGATNVTWVWCVNNEYWTNPESSNLEGVYPGDAYVDWVGIDGYNWGRNPAQPDKWRPFNEVMKQTYMHLQRFVPDKPIIIVETASSEWYSDSVTSGYKGPWITDAYSTQLPQNFPNIKAVLWYHRHDSGMDWSVDTSSASEAAFRTSIASSYYAANSFSKIGSYPIQPIGGTVLPRKTFVPQRPDAELLSNGSFDDTGSAWSLPWHVWTNTAAGAQASIGKDASSKVEGATSLVANIEQTGGSISNVRLKQAYNLLQRGREYRLTFMAKALSNTSLQVVIQPDTGATATYLNKTMVLATEWRRFTYTFVPGTGENNAALTFYLAGGAGKIWLDDVSLVASPWTEANQLQNPSFETQGSTWSRPWYFDIKNGASGSVAQDATSSVDGTRSALIQIDRSTTSTWSVQLKQPQTALKANTEHVMSFWAKASTPRPIEVTVQKGYTPYSEFVRRSILIGTTWEEYYFTFTPAAAETNALVSFNLGQSTGQVWLDGIAFGQK
jgi:hypothetical protein